MKLMKIKLINWHIFSNNTIEFSGNVLITGENASGKSTLMDAIYYVLSGGDQNHFNKAANEGGQRSIETYMRGKLGSERNPYLRPQPNIVSYILLQYFERKINKRMVLGCCLEINDSSKPKPHFFIVQNNEIKDEYFICDKKPRTYKEFKLYAKANDIQLDDLPDTYGERRKKIGRDIFKLEDYKRYFELLQNAISFKPISEVSSFVNGFLLEEDDIQLDSLREEIRSYQEIHKMVIRERNKINVLKEFVPKAEKYIENTSKIKYLNVLKSESKIEKIKNQLNRLNIEIKRLDEDYNRIIQETNLLIEERDNTNIEKHQLENNEAYRALLDKKQKLEQHKKDLEENKLKLSSFIELIKGENKLIKELGLSYRLDEDVRNKDFGLLKAHFENYKDDISNKNDELLMLKAKNKVEIEHNKEDIENKEKELVNLKRGINNYSSDVTNLIDICKNAIRKFNPKDSNPDVRPLCEYIEIEDERWANALEGYLANQRFNIIVEPRYYDVVSEAYNKYKSERNIYLAGIVNINKLVNTDRINVNSMMSKIKITNQNAEKYAKYLLGDLICVDSIKDISKYDSAVTQDVMIYKNHVLKAGNPKIYLTPFIGRNSREKRIELLDKEIISLTNLNNELKDNNDSIDCQLMKIKNSNINELLQSENYWLNIDLIANQVEELETEIKQNESDNGLLEISERIEEANNKLARLNKKISSLENEKRQNSSTKGQHKQKEDDLKNLLSEETEKLNNDLKILDTSIYNSIKDEFLVGHSLNDEKITTSYESAQKYNNAVNNELLNTMSKYTREYKPSLDCDISCIDDFVNEYYDLKNRGVVQYEMQAKEAFERAESSFREDFISKLREKIEKSQKMLDKLNKNLYIHPFGTDEEKYRFYYEPTKNSEFYNYYKIIMSGKLMNSKDLFTELLDEKESLFMQELFEKISMETNDNKTEAELQRYLDYRNYMNYDIKITNKYGEETFFSKINREKSGGETQTPFYIVMASCFDELMNKDSNKVESTCQVVFDEAFNNMDESRIKSLMEFYKQLNIQVIIIVPSNRISAISPYMDSLVGIVKANNHPHIRVIGRTNE